MSEAFPLQVNTTSNEQQSFAEERKRRRYSRAQSLGVTCPRCKSNEVLCYGKRYNKSVKKQKYNCLACGIYFSHDNKKEKLDAHEILGSWVGGHSLRMIAERYRVSKSTVYNNVRRELSAVYDWRDSGKNRKMKLSGVLSVDAAFFNRGKWVLWIATDPILGFVLAYDLREMTEHEDYYNSVLSFLYDIKETLDYYPRLLLFDDDMWIEKAVRNVLNRSNYTLCTFHLQKNLDKRLPTKQLQKRIARRKMLGKKDPGQTLLEPMGEVLSDDELRVIKRSEVKNLIVAAARARTKRERQKLLDELKSWAKTGGITRQIISEFIGKVEQYKMLEELQQLGFSPEQAKRLLYNNMCEANIGKIKKIWNDHRGFKSPKVFRGVVRYVFSQKNSIRFSIFDFAEPNE